MDAETEQQRRAESLPKVQKPLLEQTEEKEMKVEKIYSGKKVELYYGDVFDVLDVLPTNQIQSVVTSPTYWGKRQFTNDKNEFGSEKLEDYIERNVKLFSKLLNIMKPGGSLFIVIQDSYMGSGISRAHHNHWENNKDRAKKIDDRYNSSEKGKITNTTKAANRRARVKNQLPSDADFDIIKSIYTECRKLSLKTGIPHEVDHIIPIAKGGLHHQDNLQIITMNENRKKGSNIL